MSTQLAVAVVGERAERVAADLLLVAVFEAERPLRGAAGRIDWRECGLLSEQLRDGFPAGAPAASLLLPSAGRFASARALLFGLGPRSGFAEPELAVAVRGAIRRAVALRAGRVALALPTEVHSGLAVPEAAVVAVVAVAESLAAVPFPLQLTLVVEPEAAAGVQTALARLARGALPPEVGLRFANAPAEARGEPAWPTQPGLEPVPKPGPSGGPDGGRRPRDGPSSLP